MAITAVHYQLLKEHSPLFKRGGSLLEIGEANWYGDMDSAQMLMDAGDFCLDKPLSSQNSFELAKTCYQLLFEPSTVTAVDINGTARALRQDLNAPLHLTRLYDTIINHGTAEHVFNIGQVFKSIHDACRVGGYMIHDAPLCGWVDHGFYTLQPTLFYDLAAANEYELVSLSICEIERKNIVRVESREHLHGIASVVPRGTTLFVVMQKMSHAPFLVPLQGYYDGVLSEKGKAAWEAAKAT